MDAQRWRQRRTKAAEMASDQLEACQEDED